MMIMFALGLAFLVIVSLVVAGFILLTQSQTDTASHHKIPAIAPPLARSKKRP